MRRLIVTLAVAACLALLGACGGSRAKAVDDTPVQVTYRVTIADGDGDLTGKPGAPILASNVSVAYTTPTGESQEQGRDVVYDQKTMLWKAWTRTTTFQPGKAVKLVARSDDSFGDWGSITCQIKVGEKVLSQNTAKGANATATCTTTARG